MKCNWMAMLVIAGGLDSAMFGQQYPQQYPSYQGDPNYNGQDRSNQYDNGQYSDGQYTDNQGFGAYNGGPAYNGSDQGVVAPAPPPMPNYAYQRPPMPVPAIPGWTAIGISSADAIPGSQAIGRSRHTRAGIGRPRGITAGGSFEDPGVVAGGA